MRITDVLLGVSLLLSALVSLGVLHPLQLFFSSDLVLEDEQYWRLVTSILYPGNVSIRTAAKLLWVNQLSREIEQRYFHQKSVNYIFFLTVCCGLILLVRFCWLGEYPFLYEILESVMTYVGSKVLQDVPINLIFVVNVQLRYLPYVEGVVGLLLSGRKSLKGHAVGCFTGHIAWYFLEVFPLITQWHPMQLV